MKHKVITTDQGKVVIDESATIKEGDWFSCPPRGTSHKCTAMFEGNLIDNSWEGREKVEITKSSCFKILYTINFSLDKDIPMVIVEDEVERLANEIVIRNNKNGSENFSMDVFNGLVNDITKALKCQQKGVYSEEDLREVVKIVLKDAKESVIWSETYHNPLSDRIIPLLKQQYIELETETINQDYRFDVGQITRIKTNRVDGQLIAYVK